MAERIEADYETAGLDERRLSMLRYVEKLTRTPAETTKEDVERLRLAGFSDEDILQIAEVTAYYAYVNRIADGLGVELESWIPGQSIVAVVTPAQWPEHGGTTPRSVILNTRSWT